MNNFNIYQYNEINTRKIIFGKNQNYDYYNKNTIYIPIYYKDIEKSELVIKTPRLYIKNNIFQYNNSSKNFFLLDTFLMNTYDKDESNNEFKSFILSLEKRVKKIISKRKTLDITNKLFTPQIKNNFNNVDKLTLPIHKKQTKFINVDNKLIDDITTPCYGYFILLFKNIWINNDKWGININTYGCLLLPSQIEFTPSDKFDIHKSFNEEINNEKTRMKIMKEKEMKKNLNEHPVYGKFFKMKKMGIPIFVIEQKIKIQGLDFEEFKQLENNNNNTLDLKSNNENKEDNIEDNTVIRPKLNFLSEIKDKKLKRTELDKESNETKKVEKDKRVPSLDQILEALNKLKKSNCSSTV